MSTKSQNRNILITVAIMVAVITGVALLGFLFLDKEEEVIQGQVEVSEYRVSSKIPGRILKLYVHEGDYVHAGDTVAVLEAPEVSAQEQTAQAAENAATALSEMAQRGARQEQISAAYQLWQQAKAAEDITQKTYVRMENLYKEGVVSAQKRDEAQAAHQAALAQTKATESAYTMAKNGSRTEEKRAAAAQVNAAKGTVDVVKSLLKETVQTATHDGEVMDVYPKVGELVSLGSPIMSIAIMDDVWGTFNVREDQLRGLKIGQTFKAYSPAFDKDITMKVYYMKDQGSYAAWRATKANDGYDLRTFEVKAHPVGKIDGLRPGMTLVMKNN